jgi:hypothetical protein
MRTNVTKKLFQEAVSKDVGDLFLPLGFTEDEAGAFTRECGKVSHGFGVVSNPSFTHFQVPVGAFVPAIDRFLDCISGEHYPSLLVSRFLGMFKPDRRQRYIHYHFGTLVELRAQFPKMHADFVEQAEPWLAGLATIDDVAAEFYKLRIAAPSPKITRPPDPFAWAQYGWLLRESGRELEAKPWLERAYDQLKEPTFWTKGGHFVPIGTPGAKPIPRRPEEVRLAELLRKETA